MPENSTAFPATAERNRVLAVTERSGDTAFGRAEDSRPIQDPHACESGVVLRFPPQAKTL
jgi:hypothetical protein